MLDVYFLLGSENQDLLQNTFDTCFHFDGKWADCLNERLDISGSVLSTTCVSVNRTAELEKGANVCPVSDLWP